MSSLWFQLVLVGFLIVLNACFAGAEMALVTLREGQLQRLEDASAKGALVAKLARDPGRFLATIQVGITLAGFLASAAAAVSLAAPVESLLEPIGSAAGPVSVIVVTLFLAYLTLVFGELAPKRVAIQNAEVWALRLARPMSWLTVITRPIVWLLSLSTNVAVRLLGGDPNKQREEITAQEIRDLVATQSFFSDEQRQILDGAFEIAERPLEAILVPRPDVFVIDSEWTCDEAINRLAESGHSRAPVAPKAQLDQATGVVHLRLLLGGGKALASTTARPLPVLPESALALPALGDLRAARAQMALIVDEHGGAAGIVTVEDLIEELVGEIYDETDPHVEGIEARSDGTMILPGRLAIHDLPDANITLPEGPYTTVAGLILDRLGNIPEVGDGVTVEDWTLTVAQMDGRAITEVRAEPIAPVTAISDESE